MSQIWRDRIQQTVTGTPGTGAFTLSTAVAGFQALGAGDDGKTGFFCATDGTAWETFWGTYTNSGTSLARTTRIDSSTGSAISFTSAAIVFLDIISQAAQAMMLASSAAPPGGRLTLTSGLPVTTSDVTGATTVYYTPYVNNVICLWDGKLWMPTIFAEVSLALGTLTSGLPYDVFGFLNSGSLNTELLAWTNGTTRATAITIQDGRYCKSGDKTRLYLGTFYTTATTTTEDSLANRFVFNAYNRVSRGLLRTGGATNTYGTSAFREWNNGTDTRINLISGLAGFCVAGSMRGTVDGGYSILCAWLNGSGGPSTGSRWGQSGSTGPITLFDYYSIFSLLGVNTIAIGQYATSGYSVTYSEPLTAGSWQA
jgi:hypothetical protein